MPVCPHPCRFFRLSICLLDGPLCHSATNGHCWASHFLNDTLLRSIQLPCSYTLTPLPPFCFFSRQSPPLPAHFMHNTVASLPCVEEKQFLVNFLSIFSTQHASWWNNLVLSDTHTHTLSCITYHRQNNWLSVYDWSIFSPLIAAHSPTGWFVHLSFIPLSLLSQPFRPSSHHIPFSPFKPHHLVVCVCFCAC